MTEHPDRSEPNEPHQPAPSAEAPASDDAPRPRSDRRRRGGSSKRTAAGAEKSAANAPAGESPEFEQPRVDASPAHSGSGEDSASDSPVGADEDDGGPDQDPNAPAQGEGDEPQKRRRRRRRRGGRGKGRGDKPTGTDGDRPEPSSVDDERAEEPGAPVSDSQPSPPRTAPIAKRPRLERTDEHWEEIFEGKSFAEMGLRNSVLKGIDAAGFTNPTKIQNQLIPLVLAGKDVLGQSRTGTGKTAAFGLPLYQLAVRDLPFQSLILAPTRELAIQIASELAELGKFTPIRVSAVYGGQNVGAQARQLDKGPEIIVATPGRLMDMVERRHLHLNHVRFAVLDEVDRMLDIGFRDDIKRILGSIKTPHQTVFVSATISPEIEKLARTFMKDPEKLVTTGGSLTVSLVEQHYTAVQHWDKRAMLLHILTHEEPDLTVVFCRMKRTVDELAKYLSSKGIDAHPMHGDMYQGKRNAVMKRLRSGQLGVLVASDLASRGLDVDDISHVVNYDLPEDPEVYIHRIGRTARAGRRGVAWSLVTPEQGELLTAIEKLANTHIPEKKYPEFRPGPVPAEIAARRQADQLRHDSLRTINRSAPPTLPATPAGPGPSSTAAVARPELDPTKFPGGIVPTKLPPKMLGGRIRSARTARSSMLPPAPAPAPAPPPA